MLKKMVYFKACFGEIWAKLAIFYEILTLNFAIFAFFIFEDFTFLYLLMAKFGLLVFLDMATLWWNTLPWVLKADKKGNLTNILRVYFAEINFHIRNGRQIVGD